MLEQTLYRLQIRAHPSVTMMGDSFVEYSFAIQVDDKIWREGVASSAAGIGRAVGDAIRDLADRMELSYGR